MKLLYMPKFILVLFFTQISITLANQGNDINNITVEKGFKGLSGLGASVAFELNDKRHLLKYDELTLTTKNGLNKFKKIYTQQLASDPQPSKEEFYFYAKDNEKFKIILSANETNLMRMSNEGNYLIEHKIKKIKTTHFINLEPDNATITLNNSDQSEPIYSANWTTGLRKRKIPITFELLEGTTKTLNLNIIWDEYSVIQKYNIQIEAGIDAESSAILDRKNINYLNYKVKTLPKDKKEQFICENALHEIHKELSECTLFFKEENDRLLAIEREREIKQEFERKLLTSEGLYCKTKLKYKHTRDQFLNCYNSQISITAALKKFLEASSTNEGKICKKKFPKDNNNFWNCFSESVNAANKKIDQQKQLELEEKRRREEISNLLARDNIAKQCIEIGFDINSSSYKDCYLKLKLHTEQIAEWRKLQIVLQDQIAITERNNNKPNNSEIDLDQATALFGIAQRSFDAAAGQNIYTPRIITPPPPPTRIISPRGNYYNCSMVGAALRCR